MLDFLLERACLYLHPPEEETALLSLANCRHFSGKEPLSLFASRLLRSRSGDCG